MRVFAISMRSASSHRKLCRKWRIAKQCSSNSEPWTGVEIIGIVVNEKGAERAIATGAVSTLGYPYSISETFLRRNQNQSLEENAAVLEKIKDRAEEAGIGLVAYISMAFGNPYGDTWSEEQSREAAHDHWHGS